MAEQLTTRGGEAGAREAATLTDLWRRLRRTAGNVAASDDAKSTTQRAALKAFSIRVASAGIAYLSQVLLARWMGSFEYGIFVAAWVWVLILGGLSNLGMTIGMMRFMPEYREREEWGLMRGLLLGGRLIVLGSSTAIMLLGYAGLWAFGDRLDSHFLLPVYLALVCVPMFALTDVQDGMCRANQWVATGLLPPYVLRPLLILAAMALSLAAGLPMQASTAAGAAIAGTWLAGLLQTVVFNFRLRGSMPAAPRRYRPVFWLKTSLPILLITGFDLIVQNMDVLAISIYMTPRDVGIYFAGLKTMSLIAFVHYAVASATANQFSAYQARGDREGLETAVADSVMWTFWPSVVGALVILALGKPLLALFGPEFAVAYPAMFVLAAGLLVKSASGPAEFLLNMLGQQKWCGAVLMLTAALNIGLNLVLVPRFGLMGAAAATSTSLASAGLLYRILVWKRLGIRLTVAPWRR